MDNRLSYYLPDKTECWKLMFFLVIGVLCSVMLIAGVSLADSSLEDLAAGGSGGLEEQSLMTVPFLLSYLMGFVPAFVYIWYKAGRAKKERSCYGNPAVKINVPQFGEKHPFLVLSISLLGFVALVFALDALPSPVKEQSDLLSGKYPLWLVLLISGVCAPLFEELIFRGLMLRGLLRTMSPVYAILWTSVFFAIIHLNAQQAFPAFFCGVFLGWIYYKTGCYWMAVALHALNNVSAILISHFTGLDSSVSLRTVMDNDTVFFVLLLASLGLLFSSVLIINRMIPSNENEK